MRFEIYRAPDGWRWRLRAANNRIMADGGEAFSLRASAERSITTIVQWIGERDDVPVITLPETAHG